MIRLPLVAVLVLLLLAPPAEAIEYATSLTAWSLDGDLMVDGGASEAADYRTLPCLAIHAAIDEYNAGPGIDPPPVDWTPAANIGHYELTILEQDTLLSFTGFTKEDVLGCTTNQPGWLPARPHDLGQVTDGEPITRLVTGEPPECSGGQVAMVGSEFVWDWTTDRWVWGYGRNWQDASELVGAGGTVGRLTYVFACLDVVPPGSDFADVASLVPLTQVNHNPALKGLTRLDTWLWYNFGQPASHQLGPFVLSVDARGRTWDLVVEAWVDQVWWNPTCETSCHLRQTFAGVDWTEWEEHGLVLDLDDTEVSPPQTIDGGSESAEGAIAVFEYRTKGWYDFSSATIWRGIYSFNDVIYTYSPVIVADAHPYQVVEVRSQLVAG